MPTADAPGLAVTDSPDGVALRVRVIPRAKRAGIDGTRAGALLVRLTAAPVDGAANDALLDLLSSTLSLPRRVFRIASGERSRDKRILVRGVSAADLRARLERA